MMNCNPETGTCELPAESSAASLRTLPAQHAATVRYVGDPMCSWCWGLSFELKQIAQHCLNEGLGFSVTMGGLRAGGGDPWNDAFKAFLRREWSHIASATGQPFGYSLLDSPYFDYDTEPACRAVAVAQKLLEDQGVGPLVGLEFFTAVQHKFYVEGADPKQAEFYRSVCAGAGIEFDVFQSLFASAAGKQAVQAHFAQCRAMGVRSFPTLLLEHDQELLVIASGYVKAADVINSVAKRLAASR